MYVENDDGMIHYILQKQCCTNDDSFDLPLIYSVNGHSLHEYRNGDILYRNRLFLEKIGYDVKIIDVLALIEDEKKFSKIWIIESSCESERWWNKVSEMILRPVSWSRKAKYKRTVWGLSKKSSATRAAKQKDSEAVHLVLHGRNNQSSDREKGRDAALIDRVRDLEGICESLLRLPKEVKSLRGCIFKLETLIQVWFVQTLFLLQAITLKRDGVQKKEKLKKFFQKEDLLHDTSEEEPNNKDDTSPENTYSSQRIPLGSQPSKMSLSIYRC
ncbi:hypothetical protein Tco_1280005 [Tanacetum coccineum]